jgi:quercetin dioxygenase-like cupin family protein
MRTPTREFANYAAPVKRSVETEDLVPAVADSALALASTRIAEGAFEIHEPEHDSLVYIVAGSGSILLEVDEAALDESSAALILAGETASVSAGPDGLSFLHVTVGPRADRHASLGPREIVVRGDATGASQATGARSFRLLLGPHNGSTRATLFAGFVPPGRAPWHYHLYDEIVWIPDGPARVLRRESDEELRAGSAFRLRPREVHIVENPSADRELALLGIFTPAGSPSAAYLAPEP